MRMTWSLLFVALATVICQTCGMTMGSSTVRHKDQHAFHDKSGQTYGRMIFWTQYAINIFCYALGSKEFRMAYLDFVMLPFGGYKAKVQDCAEESKYDEMAMTTIPTEVHRDVPK